ncbi:hypothetical protein SAMN05443543_11311 [Flavobacterium flevense]|uniref:Uncharacterized protein n=1 Tax=Flavobacterium flevense TaxID=983 RepID=A0A4Y4B0U8_9FLAO|nr:hypothetical protein [Flavobacterium flevense]GEC72504.1 hypothetical protein FFL01_20430 [Flavobacterium flevense]SHM13667.1 hypothetical protein SAMN05443543_11311 [Flavobacterium flevense]
MKHSNILKSILTAILLVAIANSYEQLPEVAGKKWEKVPVLCDEFTGKKIDFKK